MAVLYRRLFPIDRVFSATGRIGNCRFRVRDDSPYQIAGCVKIFPHFLVVECRVDDINQGEIVGCGVRRSRRVMSGYL